VRSGVALLLRLALAGVFIFAASVKLQQPQVFLSSVLAFKVIPDHADHLVKLTTFAVPWVEIVAAACLVLGFWTRAGAAVLALTLLGFIGLIISVLERGMSVKCGCFGRFQLFCAGDTLAWCNVWQNSALLAVALLILILGPGRFALDRFACRKMEAGGATT
jgi:uncharacterized membrane protein YphA (DoxX/SURF4 family)